MSYRTGLIEEHNFRCVMDLSLSLSLSLTHSLRMCELMPQYHDLIYLAWKSHIQLISQAIIITNNRRHHRRTSPREGERGRGKEEQERQFWPILDDKIINPRLYACIIFVFIPFSHNKAFIIFTSPLAFQGVRTGRERSKIRLIDTRQEIPWGFSPCATNTLPLSLSLCHLSTSPPTALCCVCSLAFFSNFLFTPRQTKTKEREREREERISLKYFIPLRGVGRVKWHL